MKKLSLLLLCVPLLSLATGCATYRTGEDDRLIGRMVTFKTVEPAPAEFDAWTFRWEAPQLECFDADLTYVVLNPDGTEHFTYEPFNVRPHTRAGSNFAPGFAGGDPAVFRDAHIRITFAATKGRLRFFSKGSFAFHERGPDGKVMWRESLKDIDAEVE